MNNSFNFTIQFGKFKGQTLQEISDKDARYLLWLYKQSWVNNKTKNALESFIDNITLNFGKYNGRCLNNIKNDDPKYYKWLLNL